MNGEGKVRQIQKKFQDKKNKLKIEGIFSFLSVAFLS